jgi:TusA-related sulfurtransferase
MDAEVTVDARGSRCPVPINELSRALESASATVIELLADDPNARVDVPVWCRLTHHDLVEVAEAGGAWRFVVRAN